MISSKAVGYKAPLKIDRIKLDNSGGGTLSVVELGATSSLVIFQNGI